MPNHTDIGNRILIAEDDPVSRRVLEAFLKKWGFEVVTAADGLDALRILESDNAPALAVLDWMMPGMEGPQVCRSMRARTAQPYVYILLLTARSQKDDLLRGLESGADDYLTKPFNAPELKARLQIGQRILKLQKGLIDAREELRFHATHDALTKLVNRRIILDEILREHSRNQRHGGSFAIVMLDLDHFKKINDTYGHLAGDAVLQEVARLMSGCLRPYDTVGRYGGEEFLAVLPNCDHSCAAAIADRILKTLSSKPIETAQGSITLTASCGIAVRGSHQHADPQTLLLLVDEALYRAKANGRNRSEFSTEPELAESS